MSAFKRQTPGSSSGLRQAAGFYVDEKPDRAAKTKNKEVVVAPVGPHIPKKVPSGLIHDWIGVAFMPKLTISDALPVIRDYGRYKEFYRPNVIDSKEITLDDSRDLFSTVLMNKVFFKKTALECNYEAAYFRVDERRLYTISRSTRISEIAEYGATSQHDLAGNEGTGLIWRLYTVIRFEERDGGLYAEVEATALRQTETAVRAKAPL